MAALKQVLVTQLMSQEAVEHTKRSTGARLLRTTSLRTPVDSRTRVMVHNGSEKNSSQTDDQAQDLGSGDTGFFDSPEDYGEPEQIEQFMSINLMLTLQGAALSVIPVCLSVRVLNGPLILSAGYLVLEGYGSPGESSTDDDILASTSGKQLHASQGCAADSGINLRFSSTSQAGSLSSFSRQVLSHLRNLQANLNYLKVMNIRPHKNTVCIHVHFHCLI